MILKAVPWRALSLAASLLTLLPLGLAQAQAENRALDLTMARQGNRTRCVIRLASPPRYSLNGLEGGVVRLVLQDTARTEAFQEDLLNAGPGAVPDPETAAPNLGLHFALPAPLEELSAAWLPAAGALYLDILHGGDASSHSGPGEETELKRVHFGFMEMRTRMALGLEKRVPWELSQTSGDRIRLRLPTVQNHLERDRFGPAENLALATLLKADRGTEIAIQLLTRIDRVRLFWMKGRPRLVADLFEGPPAEEVTDPLQSAEPGDPPPPDSVETGGTTVFAGEKEPVRDEKEPATPRDPSNDPVESSGPVIRGRIVRDMRIEDPSPVHPGPEAEGGRDRHELPEEELLKGLNPEEALLYGSIRQAMDQGGSSRAAELCEAFQKSFPGSPMDENVCFLKGDAEFAQVQAGTKDRFPAMMKAYQHAITSYRRSPRVHNAYFNMARASSLVGNDYAAIGYLNIVLHGSSDPEVSSRAYLERGRVYLKVNQPDRAVKDFQTVLKRDPDSPLGLEARLGVARYFQAVGLHEKAEEELDTLSNEHPRLYLKHPEFLYLRGTNALYLKAYDKAREFFFQALNVGDQPEGADLLLARIGDTYHHASRPREAETVYRTVIRDYPDSDGAAISKLRLAGYDSGYEGFQALREENPNKPVADLAALEMARRLYEDGRFAMVLKPLREIMDKPFKNDIQMEARRLYFRACEKEMMRLHKEGQAEALADFYRAHQVEIRRNVDPETLLLAGLSLHQLGRYAEAASLLEGIRTYDLNQVSKGQRLLTLVDSLLHMKKEERAFDLLEKKKERALLPATDRQKLDLLLAGMYRDHGRDAEAYALYEGLVQGERLLPDRDIAAAYLEMGRIAGRDGRLEQARAALNRCIALVERSKTDRSILQQAYAELGTVSYRDGRYENALNAFQQALDEGFSPEDKGYWEMRFHMAQAYLELGDLLRAEPLLTEISEQGDGLLQKRVRIRLGMLGLEKQLQRLSMGAHESR